MYQCRSVSIKLALNYIDVSQGAEEVKATISNKFKSFTRDMIIILFDQAHEKLYQTTRIDAFFGLQPSKGKHISLQVIRYSKSKRSTTHRNFPLQQSWKRCGQNKIL